VRDEEISQEPEPAVDALVDEFCEAWFGGNPPDIAAFCDSHPELSPALRRRIDEFLFVAEALPQSDRKEGEAAPGTGGGESLETPRTIGDFTILRVLGTGGMATVYEAEQISLRRRVALKVLPSYLALSDRAVRGFQREAEAGARQSHPGIVSIYAVGQHEGVHYIAEELVEGGRTLARLLDRMRETDDPPIGHFRRMARLVAEVADALGHAHGLRVIHRDVKPSNILLTRTGRPKITDFGLARVEDALSLSRTGEFAGTPYYMSPEQAMSRRIGIDHRTDIYSLGVTLYECLTLRRPFDGRSSHEIIRKIVLDEPVDPRKRNPRIPRDLALVCLKAMEKDPARRYPDMAAFAGDLRRYLQGEVIEAKPASAATRLLRRVRRNPVVSGAVGIAVLTLVALVVYVFWSYPQILRERNLAVAARSEAERERTNAEEARLAEARQRELALEAKASAEESAAKAVAINAFLEEMLASPDPVKDGREVKVTDVLDRAAAQIDDACAGRPDLEISVRTTIGRTYIGLGLYGPAAEQLGRAFELAKARLPADDRDALAAENLLATALVELGRIPEAEKRMRHVVDVSRASYGEDHGITLAASVNLANVLRRMRRHEEARALHESILERRRRTLGDSHADTVSSMQNLASTLTEMGRFAEAEALLRTALESRREREGADHPLTLATAHGLAIALKRLGKFDEAEALLRDILVRSARVLGENHPERIEYLTELAALYGRQHRFAEAETLFREVVELDRRICGEEHPETLQAMNDLGVVLKNRGKLDESEALQRRVLEIRRRALGNENPATMDSLNNLGNLYFLQGKLREAEAAQREALELRRTVQGPEHQDTLVNLSNLAVVVEQQGRRPEAEALHAEVLRLRRKVLGVGHPDTIVAMNNLALLYRDMDRLSEAEALHTEALEAAERALGETHPLTVSTLGDLAAIVEMQGRIPEAERLWRRTLEAGRVSLPPTFAPTVIAKFRLALLLVDRGEYEEAEGLVLEARERWAASLGSEHPYTTDATRLLVRLYDAWGRPRDAERFRAELPPPGDD